MLVACKENGEKICLGDRLYKNDLYELRNKESFSCPECGEIVILKLGDKRIWHFSHQKGANCLQKYERESEYHLAGKLQLYQWLKDKGIEAELERFIQGCRQRADVAFMWQQERYAIEFQCSPINEVQFKKRTAGYIANGITPIWLLGGNQIKQIATNVVSLNHFQNLFLRRQNSGWMIPSYCPDSRQFIFLHNVLPISSKKVVASLSVLPRSSTVVSQLLNSQPEKLIPLERWLHELKKFKTSYLIYPGLIQKTFLSELYSNRLNLLTLPSELSLPVRSSPFIETPPLLWQTYLYLDIFQYARIGNIVSYNNIHNAILLRIKKQQICTRTPPLSEGGHYSAAIKEYLFLLVNISTLKKVGENKYQMLRPFKIPDSVEEQASNEKEFYQKYQKIIISGLSY